MANSAVRIVSLSPTVTKMLYQLNAQKSIVGCTSYCEVDKSDNIPIIASVVDVNIEKTLLLKPTIVFATGMTPPANIENMRKLGLNVKIIYSPKTFHEVCQQFIEIGAMVGKEKEAKTIVVKQKARIEELKLKIPKNNKPKIFFQIGARPLFTVLSNTFMDEYIKYLGGVNIAADLGSGTITRESVLVRNPDIIIITAMGIASNDEKKEW
jgi:iron complex transport system substrate-binding protein